MTQKRRDNKSTEFGLWLRGQLEGQKTDVSRIDSNLGFVATNIDYVWRCGDLFMLIEEKRFRYTLKPYQIKLFGLLDMVMRGSSFYRGFHTLIFENTNPDDGGTQLDGKWITSFDLLEFLEFKKTPDWYSSYFTPKNLRMIGRPPPAI